MRIVDTPTFQVENGKSKKTGKMKKKTIFDDDQMATVLNPYVLGDGVHCFIEKVGAMPEQGVTSMFGFGCGWGIWRGILAAYRIPRTFVTPQAWKKVIMEGISSKDDKNAARMRASQLFPRCAHLFERTCDDGRAEAALIAKYGQLQLKENKR